MSYYDRERRTEEILGSKGRIRVLELLNKTGELNISEVSRRTGLNHNTVERHLIKLEDLGLLKEKRYGRIRIFEAVFKSLTVSFERGRPIKLDIQN